MAKLYTSAEVGKLLGVTPGRIRVKATKRGLPRRMVGIQRVFTKAEVDDMRIPNAAGRPRNRQ